MANYCWNYVVFNGKATQIKKLRNKFKQYDKTNWFVEFGDFVLDKGKVGLTTEEVQKKHKDFYSYGTRSWEFDLRDYPDDDSNTFTVAGDSAWSPPTELINQICITYGLSAEMDYEEGTEDFAGIVKFDKTGIISHKEMTCHEYRYHDDYMSWKDNLAMNYEYEVDREDLEYEMNTYHSYASKAHIKDFIDWILETSPKPMVNLNYKDL
ncbi:MAG: hypothetical protein CMJ25_20795 [Phycisphaerae bacterium]|nr:hypothetical protein [Phycisphaerae bacterium]|tara:strand:- start:2345 stop:2971 length:627 start_codon:yes stop_codon:yes gene_type:complete